MLALDLSQAINTDTSIPIQVALGNSLRSRILSWEKTWEDEEDLMLRGWKAMMPAFEEPPPGMEIILQEGYALFLFQADKERDGPVYLITVKDLWNEDKESCIENEALYENSHINILTFRHQIFKYIKYLFPVTYVKIRTVHGSLEIVSQKPGPPRDTKTYPRIQDSLDIIPRVPISRLRKCPVKILHHEIDIVTRCEDLGRCHQWYVFKRHALSLVERQDRPMDELLIEVEYMNRLESPYILKPCFLVTDDSNTLFRGYLIPLMPAESLYDVFLELTEERSVDGEPMYLHPRQVLPPRPRYVSGTQNSEEPPKAPSPQLSWSTKHAWAIEAISGLVTLHASAIYTGDIKPKNILLDREGHLQHIDIVPQTRGYTPVYMAPEFDPPGPDDFQPFPCDGHDDAGKEERSSDPPSFPSLYPLTEARDMFASGIVLYQIAEEDTDIERDERSKALRLTWRAEDIEGATPKWYRDLVVRCVDSDPAKRPSTKCVLDMLESML